MNIDTEPTTIGLLEATHGKLQRLKVDGYFQEMNDGYRFAIALALAHGAIAPPLAGTRSTVFNIGTLDPDRSIYNAVRALTSNTGEPVYRTVERLAEWGVTEIFARVEANNFSFADIFAEAETLLPQ